MTGIRDFQTGGPPFLVGLVFHPRHRPDLLRSAFASVRDLVAIAIILDVVSQLLIFREIRPGAALLVGPVLITLSYSISRALGNRIARWRTAKAQPLIQVDLRSGDSLKTLADGADE